MVTDCEGRVGFYVADSLWRKKVDVIPCASTKFSPTFYSRFCKEKLVYPPPQKIDNFINFMKKEVEKKRPEMLIPISDWTLMPISKHRDEFETTIPIVDHRKLEFVQNKSNIMTFAEENRIPHPFTLLPKSLEDVKKYADDLEYPVVIKPRSSKIMVGKIFKGFQVIHASSKEDLIKKYREMFIIHAPPMIQELIPGQDYGFFALFNEGKPRAIFMHKRLREFPIGVGASTLRESTYNSNVKKYGLKILKELEWHGVAMVEFRIDNRDKKPKLMEINPRFWGSLSLAIESGVDFPYLLYKMVVEGDVNPVTKYKKGVKCRWLEGDIYRLASAFTGTYIKTSQKPNKLRILKEFLTFYQKNMHYDFFKWDNPLPFLINIAQTFKELNSYRKRKPR
jgi:predicted ATP-grasp superfamily ATP-dependent carboligase